MIKSGKYFINKRIEEVSFDEYILDIGEETVRKLAPIIKNSKLILWNGPLGKYEDGGAEATKKILKLDMEKQTRWVWSITGVIRLFLK